MLNKIIKFALNNRLAVLIASVLLVIAGVHTTRQMEVDVFPDLNAPTVVIMTEAPGMASEGVERLVTFPVETAVNGATGVRRVRSSSTTGFSVVWVEFDWGTNIYLARQIVSEKLAIIGGSLPPNAGRPTLAPQSSILGEVMIISLTSDTTSLQELRTIADWTIRPRILSTGGVAQVTVIGGEIKEYQIQLDPRQMRHYGVSIDEALAAVQGMNQNAAGGVLYESGNEYIIRGLVSTSDAKAIGSSVVKTINDNPILLEHIGTIRIGSKAPKLGTASERGKDAVLLTVTKQPNVATIDLTQKLDKAVEELRRILPSDVKVSTDAYRQVRFIESSIRNVKTSLLEGSIFVIIVLFLFLMNVRTTLISLTAIPISLLFSILALKLLNLSINTMSLGGMAIAIGSLVDDAIVDVENVYKRLRENRRKPEEEQQTVITVIFEASKEVRMPILNSTLIIIASFVPLFFLSGMEGRMLAPLGIAFIVALVASTVVALTLTPVLSSFFLAKTGLKEKTKEPLLARKAKEFYAYLLSNSLKHKKFILGGTAVALLLTLGIFFTLGRSFLPPFNEGSFTISVSTMPGVSLNESAQIGRMVEKELLSIPEIQTVTRKTGRAELDEHSLGINASEIEAPFVLDKRSKEELLNEIRQKLKVVAGANIGIGAPITHRIEQMLSGTRANVAIKVFGPDLTRLYAIGSEIKTNIQDIPGLVDLNVEQQIERPQLQIIPKREMLAKYGITVPSFVQFVNVLLAGQAVSQVYEGGRSFNLTLKVDDQQRDAMQQIKALLIDAADGRKIPLEYVAEVKSATGPNTIGREDVQRKLVVSANIGGRDLRSVVDDIRQRIDSKITLPSDYYISYGGQFESEAAASRTLFVSSIFSILVIFLLLFAQLRSVVQSAVIMLNLPLALIGGVCTIFATSGIISIPAIIGFIALFGIATRNGMLLISRYNDLQDQGLSPHQAIMQGSLDRLNPILMTALSSALALIPLAINGDQPGNEIQSPMAQVILGGLITSTLLNAFVIPIIYLLMNRKISQEIITDDHLTEPNQSAL